MKEHMLSADRDIFAIELDTRENHTLMKLQEYTKFAKKFTTHKKADAKEHGKNFKTIDHYFPIKTKIEKIKVKKEKTINKTRTWKRNTIPMNQATRPPTKTLSPLPLKSQPG